MIHTMPDASVRVTSRFPKGQSTVYLDLKHARGLTLERDRLRPETLVLRAEGGYGAGDFVGRYGGRAEAEADLADLNLMLADRHGPPPPPVAPPGRAGRKGWGWKGAVTGLALGALGAHLVGGWRTADAGTAGPSRAALAEGLLPLPSAPSTPSIPPAPRAPLARTPAAQQLGPAAPVAPPTRPQAPSQPQASAPTFGLQP